MENRVTRPGSPICNRVRPSPATHEAVETKIRQDEFGCCRAAGERMTMDVEAAE